MSAFQAYAVSNSLMTGADHYAVRVGGCGGRIIAREWGLTEAQANSLCELLEMGREEMVEA